MPQIRTCLTYDKGQAEEAARFYISIFEGGKVTSTMRAGDGGPGPKGSVLSVTFEIAGQTFFALNGGGGITFSPGMSIFVTCDTQAEVDRYWEKLSEKGKQLQCGWLQDKFGVSWQIVPKELEALFNDKDTAKAGRAMQAMMTMKKLDIAVLKRAFNGG